MSTWIIYALLAAVFAAAVTLFAKAGLAEVDVVAATAIRTFVMALFLVLFSIATGKVRLYWVADRGALWWIVASGVAGALSWLCYFLALRDGPASAVAALDRTSVVLILLGAVVWLGEPLTIRALAGAALVALGAFLMIPAASGA